MSLLIRNGHVVTMNAARDVHAGGFVLLGDDGRIAATGPAEASPQGFAGQVVDAAGMIVLPGLVNARQQHWQHLLMAAVPADAPGPLLARCRAALTPADLRVSAALAAAEMLAGGTTCVLNHAPPGAAGRQLDATLEPMAALGLRQVLALDWLSWDTASAAAAVAQWHTARQGLQRLALQVPTDVAAVAGRHVRESDITAAYRFAQEHGLQLSSSTLPDVAADMSWPAAMRRTGRASSVHLMELGVLDSRWLLAHGDHLDQTDVALMRESGCHAVCTPVAEALRGSRSAAWTALARAGVPCALGSGGPAVTCTVDMVEQMKAMLMIQNTVRLDAASLSAEAVLEMATLGGARALGLADEIGSLEAGKRGDIAVFDLRGPQHQVVHKPVSNFVSTARGADAHVVLVDGRIVWRDGAPVAAWQPAALLDAARACAAALLTRAAQEA